MLVIAVPLSRPPQTLPPPRPSLQPPPPPYLPLPTPPLNYVSGPVYIPCNFIAKCQYSCTRKVLWCQVHSSHIHASHRTLLNYNNSKHGGKRSLVNKYMRNQTDTKHIKIASLQCLPHKNVCPNKSNYKNYIHQITRPAYSRGLLSVMTLHHYNYDEQTAPLIAFLF